MKMFLHGSKEASGESCLSRMTCPDTVADGTLNLGDGKLQSGELCFSCWLWWSPFWFKLELREMNPTLYLFATILKSQVLLVIRTGSSASPDMGTEGGAGLPWLPSSWTSTFRVWFKWLILDAYLCKRIISAQNYAYFWPNDPHLLFPFGQGDVWWAVILKAIYDVLCFPVQLNVFYFKDCELHTSCGSRSLVSNPQLSSPELIQCLNAFESATDWNLHNSIRQMTLWQRMGLPLLLMHIRSYIYILVPVSTWGTIYVAILPLHWTIIFHNGWGKSLGVTC